MGLYCRFEVLKFCGDTTGVIFGFVERISDLSVYHIGVISIDGLQSLDADAIATVTVSDDDSDSQDSFYSEVLSVAAVLGVGVTEDEIAYCMDRLISAEAQH